jgi:putative acetyltransferase
VAIARYNHGMPSAAVSLERVGLPSADAELLIGELDAELTARYPEDGACHFRLDPEEVGPGRGTFLVGRVAGAPVTCGAVRLIDPATCEVKRMYTRPALRGQGLARVVLDELARAARELGATRLVLETGVRQPEAIALYERAGFARIAPFGEYVDSPLSVCMARDL